MYIRCALNASRPAWAAARAVKAVNRSPVVVARTLATAAAKQPAEEEPVQMPTQEKTYSPKIVQLVDQISALNLLEVADLNALLKSRLNISDAPVMMAATGVAAPAPVKEEEEEVAAPAAVQTSFTLKLMKFDANKKVQLIKELKNQVEGMNLVQAKKFVESAPAVVKAEIGKDEAEKIKKALEESGAECTIE